MKLNELTGVKQFRQLTLPQLIQKVMEENKFTLIGEGSFGLVFRRGNDSFVYKIFLRDGCYGKFMEYAQKNPMIYFPKVHAFKSLRSFWKRLPEHIDERLYVAKVEYLEKVKAGPAGSVAGDWRVKALLSNIREAKYEHMSFSEIKELVTRDNAEASTPDKIQYISEFIYTWLTLEDNFSECTTDIHDGNIGRRAGGSYVLIDPVFNTAKIGSAAYFQPGSRDKEIDDFDGPIKGTNTSIRSRINK
jgi:hypothetical protein